MNCIQVFDWAKKMAPEEGFEPPTNWLTANCSTTELLRNVRCNLNGS